MSNCLWGGRDEDEKDDDVGEGRDDDVMTEEEEEEERRMRKKGKDNKGLTMKGRGMMREMMAQETSSTSLGP
jgi:hypothetical protein